jgi:RNA polymerase sigma factor (sigma-70 family)
MQPLSFKNAPRRFSRGDSAAGGWIYKEFKPFVFTLVSNMTDPSGDTSDLVHDVFSKLFANHGRFANRESIRSLLNQIGVRVCLNYLKRKENKTNRTTEFIDDSIFRDDGAIEKAESNATLHDLLWRAVLKLPEKKRAFFLLFYKDDLSNMQISERLGISVQTAANKKSIILQTLKLEIVKMAGDEINELSILLLISFLYETL